MAAAYWISGRLGLLLAIPPGYATAVWPPSGIALACLLIFGYRNLLAQALDVVRMLLLGGGARLPAAVE